VDVSRWFYWGNLYCTRCHIVQRLGVLEFTLYSVGGMLIGSLLIDLAFPTKGTIISSYLVAGIALTYLGVFINRNVKNNSLH
jgi:uncharacterized membrane protein YdcZ (DUF606 family)